MKGELRPFFLCGDGRLSHRKRLPQDTRNLNPADLNGAGIVADDRPLEPKLVPRACGETVQLALNRRLWRQLVSAEPHVPLIDAIFEELGGWISISHPHGVGAEHVPIQTRPADAHIWHGRVNDDAVRVRRVRQHPGRVSRLHHCNVGNPGFDLGNVATGNRVVAERDVHVFIVHESALLKSAVLVKVADAPGVADDPGLWVFEALPPGFNRGRVLVVDVYGAHAVADNPGYRRRFVDDEPIRDCCGAHAHRIDGHNSAVVERAGPQVAEKERLLPDSAWDYYRRDHVRGLWASANHDLVIGYWGSAGRACRCALDPLMEHGGRRRFPAHRQEVGNLTIRLEVIRIVAYNVFLCARLYHLRSPELHVRGLPCNPNTIALKVLVVGAPCPDS